MKKASLTAFLLLFTVIVGAQDLIITNQGDSINCYLDLNNSNKSYRIGTPCKNGVKWKRIPIRKVFSYKKEFYKENPVVTDKELKEDQIYPRWRFALDLGGIINKGWLDFFNKENRSNFEGYSKSLMKNINITYFTSKKIGFGLLYKSFSLYKTKLYSKEHLHQNIFLGTFTFRKLHRQKRNAWYFSCGAGVILYNHNMPYTQEQRALRGTNKKEGYAFLIEFGYDLGLTKNISLGARTSFLLGSLRVNKEIRGIDHYTATAGIRYNLW